MNGLYSFEPESVVPMWAHPPSPPEPPPPSPPPPTPPEPD